MPEGNEYQWMMIRQKRIPLFSVQGKVIQILVILVIV